MMFTSGALNWLGIVLEERYGFNLTLRQNKGALEITLPGSKGAIIFDRLLPELREFRSDFTCGQWSPAYEGFLPILNPTLPMPGASKFSGPLVELKGSEALVHYDILGLTYWMLCRLEEIGRSDLELDKHGRFYSALSHAYKHNYIDRPIVDEWLMILGQIIQRIWPHVKFKKHKFDINVSHDVDSPSRYGFRSVKALTRAMVGDVIKYRNVKSALIAPWVRMTSSQRIRDSDPFNTFDWLMDVSEANNLKSAFYFICGRTDPLYDADYEPEHRSIRELIRRIHARQHEIGLHPSYGTYQKPELIRSEAQRLKRICAEENVGQQVWGGRMHYLRWEHPTTLQAWADADMDYDSTLGYADRPGFRCGTCFEYPAFNALTQKTLKLRLRPLIVMESAVISSQYMGLGYSQCALDKFLQLKNCCREVGGQFNVLWHNSHFMTSKDFDLYQAVLSG